MGCRKRQNRTLLGNINENYVYISNRMTERYEEKYGFYCDLYFPRHKKDPKENGEYPTVNLFEPHEMPDYPDEPDVVDAKFYIPNLLKKENMNSPDLEFDSMYLTETEDRPFIETSKKRELPIQTKVVVHIGESVMNFFVDIKTVVNLASGHGLLRMYLSPLLENGDGGYNY